MKGAPAVGFSFYVGAPPPPAGLRDCFSVLLVVLAGYRCLRCQSLCACGDGRGQCAGAGHVTSSYTFYVYGDACIAGGPVRLKRCLAVAQNCPQLYVFIYL